MFDVNAYLGHFAFRQLRHNNATGLLRLMDRFHIERAAVSSAAAITYRNSHAGNEEVAAEVKGHTDRLVPFAVLNPAYAGWKDDLKICHDEFGMKGIRIYPRWHGYKMPDPRCLDLVRSAGELNMVISIPFRAEDRRQQSWLVDVPNVDADEAAGLIRACPETRFILGNGSGFSGSSLGRKGESVPANFAVEITLLSAEFGNEIGQLTGLLGEDRVLFGTGMPFNYPGPAIAKVEILPATDALKEKIRRTNAVRWLKL